MTKESAHGKMVDVEDLLPNVKNIRFPGGNNIA